MSSYWILIATVALVAVLGALAARHLRRVVKEQRRRDEAMRAMRPAFPTMSSDEISAMFRSGAPSSQSDQQMAARHEPR